VLSNTKLKLIEAEGSKTCERAALSLEVPVVVTAKAPVTSVSCETENAVKDEKTSDTTRKLISRLCKLELGFTDLEIAQITELINNGDLKHSEVETNSTESHMEAVSSMAVVKQIEAD
jgi:hypothetical protein